MTRNPFRLIPAWFLRRISGVLYGPLWLDGSDWCDKIASRLEYDS